MIQDSNLHQHNLKHNLHHILLVHYNLLGMSHKIHLHYKSHHRKQGQHHQDSYNQNNPMYSLLLDQHS